MLPTDGEVTSSGNPPDILDLFRVLSVLMRDGKPLRLVLEYDGRRAEVNVGAHSPATPLTYIPSPSEGSPGDTDTAGVILTVLAAAGKPLKIITIASRAGRIHNSHFRTTVRQLKKVGKIVALPEHRYGLTEDQPDAQTLTDCARDILEIFRSVGRRLVEREVRDEVARRKMPHGDSTITHALCDLKKRRGALTNESDARGKGYGLAEWSASPPAAPETDCERDIVLTIREADRRLIGDEIKRTMENAQRIHGESTIAMALAKLVKFGVLTNAKDAHGKGYGLPHLDRSTPSLKLNDTHNAIPVAPSDMTPKGLTQCETDMVEAIRQAERRLTGETIKQTLDRSNKLHGESTIEHALGRLVKLGVLTNCKDERGHGYGLP